MEISGNNCLIILTGLITPFDSRSSYCCYENSKTKVDIVKIINYYVKMGFNNLLLCIYDVFI